MKRSVTAPKRRIHSIAAHKKRRVKSFQRTGTTLMVHVKHTGRLVPHSATSYPLLTFLVLVVGVLMALCTAMATASSDSYVVHAVVPGIAPSLPATITTPVDQDRFTSTPITVSGGCPANAVYIKLYRNDFFSGAALCQSGEYTLQTDLFPGANQLIVHSFNGADIEGPVSVPVKVYYDVPGQPSGGGSASNTSSGGTSSQAGSVPALLPPVISADYLYRGYYVNQQISWRFGITGGVEPYSIHYDWGDGTDTIKRQAKSGQMDIAHTYTKPVSHRTSYIIKIIATDAQGNTTFMQLVVLIAVPGINGAGVVSNYTSGPTSALGILQRITTYAWPIYGITLLMLSSFWLGEHREFNLLRNHIRSPKRFHRA